MTAPARGPEGAARFIAVKHCEACGHLTHGAPPILACGQCGALFGDASAPVSPANLAGGCSERWWAVLDPAGHIQPRTVRRSRAEAVFAAEADASAAVAAMRNPWKELQRRGYQCRPITVIVETDDVC